MVVVDASVWISYLADKSTLEAEWLTRNASSGDVSLTDLTLCEILQGIRDDRAFQRILQRLILQPIFDTGGIDLSIAAAENYRILRAKGITVRKTIDCLIATFCIRGGHVLLHRDADFDHFEKHLGLRVLHP
ncbi:MAG TPA: PIN domain nuclease [Acidobacteriaceae bacterium]|nr:PIN domain nuclease [Acidobacteriaceae bacterium]